jgi:hypothetical protein
VVALVNRFMRCGIAAALGISWHVGTLGIALSVLVLLLWRFAASRREAAALGCFYHLAGAGPVLCALYPSGYGDLGLLQLAGLACLASLLMGGVWAAAWSPNALHPGPRTALRVALLLAVTALPGLGMWGLQNPLTAAGVYFPGTGWAGLAGVVAVLGWCPRRPRGLAAALGGLGLLSGVSQLVCAARAAEAGPLIEGRSTQLSFPDDPDDYYSQALVALTAQESLPVDRSMVVMPEGVGGLWTPEMQKLWAVPEAQTLLLGATIAAGERFDNVAIALSARGEAMVAQRVPVPGVMWRPWRRQDTYRAHPWSTGVLELAHLRVGVLLCYEQMLVFPVLWSVLGGAKALAGLSNLQAFSGYSLVRWQRASLEAWGALFDLPVAYASNTRLDLFREDALK